MLVVVAHPDDEAFGCGGTIARMSDAGADVRVLLPLIRCGERRNRWTEALLAFEQSCALLGAKAVLTETLIDETRAETHLHDLHDAILPHVAEADLVLTHSQGDANQVHRGVSRAVEIATRPFRRRRDVLLFEVPTSSDQGFSRTFSPDTHVRLREVDWQRKAEALQEYHDELVPGRRLQDLRRLAELRGVESGSELAESFVTARRFL